VHNYNYYVQLTSNIQNGSKTPIDNAPSYKKTSVYKSTIENLISKPYIKAKHIYHILKKDYDYNLSYSSFNRYMNSSFLNHSRNNTFNESKLRTDITMGFGFTDNVEIGRLWLQKLVQGKFTLNDIRQELRYHIPFDDIEKLYHCILHKSLRYRNRAIGILALYKGIPQSTITECLLISKSTLLGYFEMYVNKGVTSITTDKGKRLLKHENQTYINKIFSILHSPPSSFGFNRTSWRQRDIQKVMSDNGMPVSKHVIKKIIDNAGYKYRKAKTVLTSTDPEYKAKVQKIKNILSNLGPKEKFISIDDFINILKHPLFYQSIFDIFSIIKQEVLIMTTSVKDILHSFEILSEDEKRELASEIIRQTVRFDLLPLTDEELISCAEEVFLELDRRESESD